MTDRQALKFGVWLKTILAIGFLAAGYWFIALLLVFALFGYFLLWIFVVMGYIELED